MTIIFQDSARLGDPHMCSDAKDRLSIQAAIYEPLMRRIPGAGYAPALATGWSVDDRAQVWDFTLRNGVRCHNGDTIIAEDVVASLARVCDPAMGGELGTQGVYRSYLDGAHIQALDSTRVRISTPEPLADLLDILAELPIVPRRALSSLPDIPVGSGPFRLVSAQSGRIELVAFDDYWGGAPATRQLVFQAESDPMARAEAVISGMADIAAEIEVPGRALILASGSAQLVHTAGGLCVILMCNALSGPCMDRRVRQALNYAIDVDSLVSKLHPGAAEILNGPLTLLHSGYDPDTQPYPYDPDRARRLLAEAGFAGGLTLTLDAPLIWPDESVALAALVQAQLALVGIELLVRHHADRPGYAEMVRDKRIGDLCVFDSSPLSTFRVLREKIHSGVRGPWWQGYTNAETDRLIDMARMTPDLQQRQAIYRRVYRQIRDDAPWVFLYAPRLFWAVGSRVAGWQPAADGVVRVV